MFSATGRPLGEIGWWQDFKSRTDDGDDDDGDVYDNNGGDDGDNDDGDMMVVIVMI